MASEQSRLRVIVVDDEAPARSLLRQYLADRDDVEIVAECADVLKRYRVGSVTGDRYAGEWPREAFRAHAIDYHLADLDKSRLYLELLAQVNAEAIEIPDDPALLRELRGLERRRGPSGRDRVDHRPGAHDDRANALAGVVVVCQKPLVEWAIV